MSLMNESCHSWMSHVTHHRCPSLLWGGWTCYDLAVEAECREFVTKCCRQANDERWSVLQCVAVCCSVLQCVECQRWAMVCHDTYQRVMSHINESWYLSMSHVACQWVMSHVNGSCHMSMCHVTCESVMSHLNKTRCKSISHVTYE